LSIRDGRNALIAILRIEVILEGATMLVVFKEESAQFPPYRIENFTNESLTVHQVVRKRTILLDIMWLRFSL
jgi:hypothetical protein